MKKELEVSRLIQRLKEPTSHPNPFAFGGGYRNGGLSDEVMAHLKDIFSFDYMGDANYEFGIIHTFFKTVNDEIKNYSQWKLLINKVPVYIIGKNDEVELINDRLKEIAEKKVKLRDYCGLHVVVGLSKHVYDTCNSIGWLELNNNFAFFAKKETADKLFELFLSK